MTVEMRDDTIILRGACAAQDAETLASYVARHRSSSIDASACESVHSAVLQVLLAFKPRVSKMSSDAQLNELISQVTAVIDG